MSTDWFAMGNDPSVRIEISFECGTCNGEGIVGSPEWEEFNKKWHAADKDEQKRLAIEEEPSGPEELQCCDCEGAGCTKRQLTLSEFKELMHLTHVC